MTPTRSLKVSATSLLELITHSRDLISSGRIKPTSSPTIGNPLDILHDIGSVTRAHITKLSIAIRPPNIIHDAAVRCIQDITLVVPHLLGAVEMTASKDYGNTLYAAVVGAADNVLAALEDFVKEIPEMFKAGKSGVGRDRLACTGVVWQAADELIGLRAKGLVGVVQDAVKLHMDILKDAASELKEWLESVGGDDGEDEAGEEENDEYEDAFWDAPRRGLEKDDVETREKAEASLKKMRLITILLSAVGKRRLAGAGKLTDVKRLDWIAELAKSLANLGDDIGMGYYDGDADEALNAQKEFEKKAMELAELSVLADDGSDDTFSKWFRDCNAAISNNS